MADLRLSERIRSGLIQRLKHRADRWRVRLGLVKETWRRTPNINLGGGDFSREGWCNLDLTTGYDVSTRLLRDFPSENADIIYTSHFLEHIEPEKVRILLRNAYRVLKRNGTLRISGPDLDLLTEKVLQGEDPFMAFVDSFYDRKAMGCDYVRWYLYVCGNPDRFGRPNGHPPTQHCWMVSANIIIYFLIAAGFEPSKIRRSAFGQSRVPELRESCFDNRKELSFFVEAVK